MTTEKDYGRTETKVIEQEKLEDTNLVLSEGKETYHTRIVFCDERQRSGRVPMFSVASVTLDSEDTSWGEFLSAKQLEELHTWTGELLADINLEGGKA